MHRLRTIFAAVALAYLLAPLAASAPLFDPDEGLHAAIAQEMVLRGDYVTPTFLGQPFLDKPILFFWAEAASLRLFGDHETAVRIPPLLFGLFGMISVALLGRSLFDEATGLLGGIVYATMLLPLGVSQVAVHDIGLVPFMCLAAYCLHRVSVARASVLLTIAAGVCLGLSILTKGLVGIVFTGIFGACLALHRPAATVRLGITFTGAVIVAAIVAAPWYFAMEAAHPGYLHYYFVERHLQGYLTATQRHAGRPWWYYVPIVLGGTLPWTAYLAGAMFAAIASARAARDLMAIRTVLWGWFATGLVFLSLGESKLATYALPLFPILALLIGDYVTSAFAAANARDRMGVFSVALVLQVVVLAVTPAAGLLALQWKFSVVHSFVWIGVVALGVLTLYAGRRAARAATRDDCLGWLARASILSFVGMMSVTPKAAAWMTSRDLAQALNAGGALPSRVSVLDERIGSLVFYLDPALRAEASADRLDEASFSEAIGRVRVDPDDAVLAVRNTQLARFNRLFATPPPPDGRAGTFTIFRAVTLRNALAAR